MARRDQRIHGYRFPLALFCLTALSSCGGQTAGEPVDAAAPVPDLPAGVVAMTAELIRKGGIEIVQSREMDLRDELNTTGVIMPNESRVAHIRPLARGVVETVYVRRGDRVSDGQPLVLYDNIELGELIGEYRSEQAELQKRLARLEVSRKFWERGRELLEKQAIARKEVELREAQFKDAEAAVKSQEAEISKTDEKLHRFGLSASEVQQLKKTEHSAGHRTASHNVLRAPFSGVIIGYDVAEGELVGPERELLMLADISTVWVMADVYQKDLARIRKGARARVFSNAYPGRSFQGRVTYISDLLDPKTRTARVRCEVPNLGSLLKLQMFVTVRIPALRRQISVAVPDAALQSIDGQEVVFVAEGEGRFRKTVVKTGLSVDGWTGVTGLEAGVPVVSRGSFYVKSALEREKIGGEE